MKTHGSDEKGIHSEYEKAGENLKNSKGIIHLIGDFGIGKTHLIDSVKEKYSVHLDYFLEENEEPKIMKLAKGNAEKFPRRLRWYKWSKNSIKFLFAFITLILTATLPTLIFAKISWKHTVLFLVLGAAILLVISLLISTQKINKKMRGNWYIENIDRLKWSKIVSIFQWAYEEARRSKDIKIVFSYSNSNIAERYKETFGFKPKSIEFLIDKYIDKTIDLNLYKKDKAEKIVHQIFEQENVKIKYWSNSLLKIEPLNFRNVTRSVRFMSENETAIKSLLLDPKLVFLINYLSQIDKAAFIQLYEDIDQILHNENRSFLDQKWYEKLEWNQDRVKVYLKQNNQINKRYIKQIPQIYKNSEKLIELIYDWIKYYLNDKSHFNKTAKVYFLNGEILNAVDKIKKNKINDILNLSGIDPYVLVSKAKEKIETEKDKHDVLSFIAKNKLYSECKYYIDEVAEYRVKTAIEQFEQIHDMYYFFRNSGYIYNQDMNDSFADNYCFTPFLVEYLDGIEDNERFNDINNKIKRIFKNKIENYIKLLEIKPGLSLEVNDQWLYFEVTILRNFLYDITDTKAIDKNINQWKEIRYGLFFYEWDDFFNKFKDLEFRTGLISKTFTLKKLTSEEKDSQITKAEENKKILKKVVMKNLMQFIQ